MTIRDISKLQSALSTGTFSPLRRKIWDLKILSVPEAGPLKMPRKRGGSNRYLRMHSVPCEFRSGTLGIQALLGPVQWVLSVKHLGLELPLM